MIYLFLVIYLIVCYKLFKKNKKLCVALSISSFILLTSLRSIYLGLSDTSGVYLNIFNNIKNYSFIDIMQNIFNTQEYGFFIIFKLITSIFNNYRILLFFVALPYFGFVARYIYKYSNNYVISFVVFASLYFLLSFYLIKQCIAIGILIFSYDFIVEKKPIKFLLTVLVATFFHKMSFIFFIAYPFANKLQFKKINYIYIFIAFMLGNFGDEVIYFFIKHLDVTNTLIEYINNGIYSSNQGYGIFGYLINVVILIFCHMFCYKKDDKRANIDLNLLTLGCIFNSFCFFVTEFYRVAFFFNIFGICRISNINSDIPLKYKKLIKIMLIAIFTFYLIFFSSDNYNANPYVFFWE